MNINIPPALMPMGQALQEFMDSMVHKLNVNSHKDALNSDDIDGLLAKMQEEIQEFRDQRIQDADDPNMLAELADTANFAFLIYAFLRARGVKTVQERFIDEFFTVDAEAGKVYCARTRSGSPLKVGDEVRGHCRGKRVFIRAQHSVSGASVSVPRASLVWRAHTGQWPAGPLRYRNGKWYDDRLENLDEVSPIADGPTYPFVSRHAPRGKENTLNWGRWVYQRRHAFKLVRVGYWDTPEEAAREGLKAWKEKIKETGNV